MPRHGSLAERNLRACSRRLLGRGSRRTDSGGLNERAQLAAVTVAVTAATDLATVTNLAAAVRDLTDLVAATAVAVPVTAVDFADVADLADPVAVAAAERREHSKTMTSTNVILASRQLTVTYGTARSSFLRSRRNVVQALRGVDLDIYAGETLALVGESGSGKSTLARALVRCIPASSGSVAFKGSDITTSSGRPLRALRRHLQMIFQDPFGSLNPRLSIGSAIGEPLIVHGLAGGRELKSRVAECLALVGLDASVANRRPHEFSGGQRQRICIARALACRPELIAADEVLSALDLSLRGQMLELFRQLKERLSLTYLFISHDLGVVRQISDRVAVMYLGRIVELATTPELYNHPRHPYTHALLAAVPIADPVVERSRQYASLPGEPPSPARPPSGCAFHTRCPRAVERCRTETPHLTELTPGHAVACHRPH